MSDDEKKALIKQFNRELEGFHAVLCMSIRCAIAAHNDVPNLVELLKQVEGIDMPDGEKLNPVLMNSAGKLIFAAYGNLDVALGLVKPEDRERFESLLVRGEGSIETT